LQAINPKIRVTGDNAIEAANSASGIDEFFKKKIINVFSGKEVFNNDERKNILNRLQKVYSNTYDEYSKARDVWAKGLIMHGTDPSILNAGTEPPQNTANNISNNISQNTKLVKLKSGQEALALDLGNGKYKIVKYF
jgi:predicted phage tail protein